MNLKYKLSPQTEDCSDVEKCANYFVLNYWVISNCKNHYAFGFVFYLYFRQ